MSEQKVSIFVDLNGNLTERAERFGRAMTGLSRKGRQGMQALGAGVSRSSAMMDSWGNRAVLAGTAAGYGFKKTFVDTAAQFERFQIMLNKLQGGEAGGAKAMAWVQQFAQDTPLALEGVTQAFVKLKAFGLDPMDGTLQAIVDQASMMGGGQEAVEGIAMALGQAWTKGKLQGEEALQLLERGVPVWDLLVKKSQELKHNNGAGYTAAQLQDMASKGQLGRKAIKDLIDEIGKSSKGAAINQMKTWAGMTANLGDNWTNFQKDVMDSGAFDFLKNELKGLLDEIARMKETGEYDKLVETVGTNLVEGFKTAKEAAIAIKDVATDLKPVVEAIGKAMQFADAKIGYANLAKTLAALYLVNKAMRMGGAPVAQAAWKGAAWGYGKVRGKGGPGDMPAAGGPAAGGGRGLGGFGGAVPVYLVDGPMSAIPDRKNPNDPNGKKTPSRTQPAKAGRLARIGETLSQGAQSVGGGIKNVASGITPGTVMKTGVAGAAVSAVMLAPVLMSDAPLDQKVQATGEAVGGGLGGWGGAAMGAAIGTAILPGIGTAIGGLLGGVLGVWGGSELGGAAAEQVNSALDLTVKIEGTPGLTGQVTSMKSSGADLNADVYNGTGMSGR